MKRFSGRNETLSAGRGNTLRGMVISVIMFLGVLVLFLTVVGKTSEGTLEEQKRYLEEAVEQSLLQCYVTEGRYPESFSYLEEKYGLIYDKEHFRVDYTVYGSNLYPEVKVLVLKE